MIKPPKSEWLPVLKMTYGCLLLVCLAILAATIALGHVEEKTSFGLSGIITGLLMLTSQFAQYAFGGDKKDNG